MVRHGGEKWRQGAQGNGGGGLRRRRGCRLEPVTSRHLENLSGETGLAHPCGTGDDDPAPRRCQGYLSKPIELARPSHERPPQSGHRCITPKTDKRPTAERGRRLPGPDAMRASVAATPIRRRPRLVAAGQPGFRRWPEGSRASVSEPAARLLVSGVCGRGRRNAGAAAPVGCRHCRWAGEPTVGERVARTRDPAGNLVYLGAACDQSPHLVDDGQQTTKRRPGPRPPAW